MSFGEFLSCDFLAGKGEVSKSVNPVSDTLPRMKLCRLLYFAFVLPLRAWNPASALRGSS